jgi:hypothetical protein
MLLQRAYATVASESEFKSRSLALSFVLQTWDLMPSVVVAQTLDDFLQQLITRPSDGPGGGSARNMFGPQVLELMTMVDSQRAAALAEGYPDLETARHVPGKTSGNPLNGPRGLSRPVTAAPLPPPRPARRLSPITVSEFKAAVEQARTLPIESRIARLIALAYLDSTQTPRTDASSGDVAQPRAVQGTGAPGLRRSQIDEAIELGKNRRVPQVRVVTLVDGSRGDYDVFIFGPVGNIASAAYSAVDRGRDFDMSSVTPAMAIQVLVHVQPKMAPQGGTPVTGVVLHEANAPESADLITHPVRESGSGSFRDAYFDRLPAGPFRIRLTTTVGQQTYGVSATDRAQIR